jgi:hypothetical protein
MKLPEPLLATTFVAATSVAATSPAGQVSAEDGCGIDLSDVQRTSSACRFSTAVKEDTQNLSLLATFVCGKLQVGQ